MDPKTQKETRSYNSRERTKSRLKRETQGQLEGQGSFTLKEGGGENKRKL